MNKIQKRKRKQRKLAKARLAKKKDDYSSWQKFCLDLTTINLPSLAKPDLVTVCPITSLKLDDKDNTSTLDIDAFDTTIIPEPKSNVRLSLVNAHKQSVKVAKKYFKNCLKKE